MAKKEALPEITVSAGDIVLKAVEAVQARGRASQATADEAEAKSRVSTEAVAIRMNETDKGNYIGLIRVATSQAPVRIEFRINNGALDINEEPKLDTLFGASRPELFERAEVVTEITDPEALYQHLKQTGLNPWDFIDLRVKDEAGLISHAREGFNTAVAILPKKGFLAKLSEIATTLSKEAKEYVNKYLDNVLKPTVVLGTKAEGT